MKRVASPTRQAPANDPKKNRISSPETGQNNPAVQDVQTSVLKSQSAEFPVKITLKLKKPSSDASVIHSQKTAVSPVGAPVAPQALISQDKENMATKRQLDKMQLKPEQRAFVEKLIMDARKRGAACKSIVVNDARLLSTPEGVAEKFLGHVIYTGAKSCNLYSNRGADLQLFLLPEFSLANHYSTIQVRIPAEYLSYRGNIAVRKSALWGTDVYTDDSDVVAMIIHSGHYRPVDAPDPTPEESQLIDKSIAGHLEASTAARNPISTPVQPLVAGAEPIVKGSHIMYPDHDLHVLLRVLPRLVKYAGSTRFGLDSRAWGTSHDGESVQVVKVERIARGSVGKQGRKVFSKQWGDLAKSVTKDSEDLAFPDGDYTHRNPEHEDDTTVVFSQVDGGACIKYTSAAMAEWPPHMLNILHGTKDTHSAMGDGWREGFTKEILDDKKAWPFWRIKLLQFKCVLESQTGKRYTLSSAGEAVYQLESEGIVLSRNVQPDAIAWTTDALVIGGAQTLEIGLARLTWLRKPPYAFAVALHTK